MKMKILLAFFIGITVSSYSQDVNYLWEYTLINKLNEDITVYGFELPVNKLHGGFAALDKTGKQTGVQINPDDFVYLIFKNSEGKVVRLKSLPFKNSIGSYMYSNAFMLTYIENLSEDMEQGKVNFYVHEFSDIRAYSFGDNGIEIGGESRQGYKRKYFKSFYFEDLYGLHKINNKSDFNKFPELLGKELYRKMRRSDMEYEDFLFNYFTNYNNSIDSTLVSENL
ncbi:hypothetical protein SAMN04489722_103118 [Algibacter lectus]|nr:hypothetical protein SAMN04489722_103118 [Algibacter lectus]